MNYSEMSPEMRASIDATANDLANDSNPNKGQEVAAKYAAEVGPELELDTKNALEVAYNEAMSEVLFNAGLDITSERGQRLVAAKEKTIETVMAKIVRDKIPADMAGATLTELLPELVPDFKEANT